MSHESQRLCDNCPIRGEAVGCIGDFVMRREHVGEETTRLTGMAVDDSLRCSHAFELDPNLAEQLREGLGILHSQINSCERPIAFGPNAGDSTCLALGPQGDPKTEEELRRVVQRLRNERYN